MKPVYFAIRRNYANALEENDVLIATCAFCDNQFPFEPTNLAMTCPKCKESETEIATLEFYLPETERYLVEEFLFAARIQDNTLGRCIDSLRRSWRGGKLVLGQDFEPHSFIFCANSGSDANDRMNGGIIYHGRPEEGYRESSSVMLNPSCGWHTHT